MKKEVNRFIIVDFINLLLKVLFSFIGSTYAILESALYDLLHVVIMLLGKINGKSKFNGIITSLIGLIFIIGSLGIIYLSFYMPVKIMSAFIILFILLFMIIKYSVSCLLTNRTYSKKSGIISFSNTNSNIDFYNIGILILVMIVGKISRWVDCLKYADRIGTILLSALVIIKGIKIIINSFKYMSDYELEISDEYKNEITNRKEIKALDGINVTAFGGIRCVTCDVAITEGISILDINTFMLTICDYILKLGDLSIINMTNGTRKIKTVKRVKPNARNSGSRNSKTNSKKTNTKKKNKKR